MMAHDALAHDEHKFHADGSVSSAEVVHGFDPDYTNLLREYGDHSGVAFTDGSMVIFEGVEWVVFGGGISEYLLPFLDSELERVGVSDIGPADSVCVTSEPHEDDLFSVRVYDDGAQTVVDVADAIKRLSTLADGAGWVSFWEAFTD